MGRQTEEVSSLGVLNLLCASRVELQLPPGSGRCARSQPAGHVEMSATPQRSTTAAISQPRRADRATSSLARVCSSQIRERSRQLRDHGPSAIHEGGGCTMRECDCHRYWSR